MAMEPEELEEIPPQGHVKVVYLGPVAPHWEVHGIFGDGRALGVAGHPLAVAAELRIVWRQEQEAGLDPSSEVVDHLVVAEVGADLPVRRHGAEVDDAHVPDGLDELFTTVFDDVLVGVGGHGTSSQGRRAGARIRRPRSGPA